MILIVVFVAVLIYMNTERIGLDPPEINTQCLEGYFDCELNCFVAGGNNLVQCLDDCAINCPNPENNFFHYSRWCELNGGTYCFEDNCFGKFEPRFRDGSFGFSDGCCVGGLGCFEEELPIIEPSSQCIEVCFTCPEDTPLEECLKSFSQFCPFNNCGFGNPLNVNDKWCVRLEGNVDSLRLCIDSWKRFINPGPLSK